MTTIDLIPTDKPEINQPPVEIEHASQDCESSASPAEPGEHQSIDVSEHKQTPSSPKEVKAETRQEESEVPPTVKRGKGRPPGSKNKEPRKRTVKLEPVQADPLEPVKEEPVIEETKPTLDLSPISHRRQLLQTMALKRREQQQARIAHYTSLLDKRLGF